MDRFWIFLAIAMSINFASCEEACHNCKNLTTITWAHAVNDDAKLDATLADELNQMIEADVVIGTYKDGDTQTTNAAIMAHPPNVVSDLSLEKFLKKVQDYNAKHEKHKRGIKLDFKSIEALEKSTEELKKLLGQKIDYEVWINADIIKGPVNAGDGVDPKKFFAAVAIDELKNTTLSIGWTTKEATEGNYTTAHITAMLEAIKEAKNAADHPITFPVRAAYAAKSEEELKRLLKDVTAKSTTLTVWSPENDNVDVAALKKLILSVGVDRVYVDLPEKIHKTLDLSNSASSLAQFGLINLAVFMLCYALNNQH